MSAFTYLAFGPHPMIEKETIKFAEGPLIWPVPLPEKVLENQIVDGTKTLKDGFKSYSYHIEYGAKMKLANGQGIKGNSGNQTGSSLTIITKGADFLGKLMKLLTVNREAIKFVALVATTSEGYPDYALIIQNAWLTHKEIIQNPVNTELANLYAQVKDDNPVNSPLIKLEFTGEIVSHRTWVNNAQYSAGYNFANSQGA